MLQKKRTLPLWLSRLLAAVIFLALVLVIGVVGYTLVTNQFIDLFVMFRDVVVLGYMTVLRFVVPFALVILAGVWLERKLHPAASAQTLGVRFPALARFTLPRISERAFLAVLFIGVLWMAAIGLTIARFFFGLGYVTNLTDEFPWGIWIGFDVVSGVALAAGGFVICGTVHVFNIKRFHPIMRPAILTAFLGYLLVIVGLLFDLGRWYNVWHPMFMWNLHSPLLEVAWCVMLYTTVLALEFSPVVFEKFNLKWPLKVVRAITLPLVIVGMLLSTLHQSSIGSLFLIFPEKISPLWYTPMLPVFFFISAVMVGLAMTIVESNLSARAFGKSLESDLLASLGKAAGGVAGIYLALKMIDLFARGATAFLSVSWFHTTLYTVELVLGVIVPMLILATRRGRENPRTLYLSGWLLVGGVILNRLNTALLGWWAYANGGSVYIPSLGELTISIALVSVGVVAFGLIAKYFPVFEHEEHAHA